MMAHAFLQGGGGGCGGKTFMIPSWETLVLRPCGWGVRLKCAQ